MKTLASRSCAVLLGLGASCSSTVLADYPDQAFIAVDALEHGQFQAAAEEFSLLSGTFEGTQFLSRIESGMALHLAGDLEAATARWLDATATYESFGDRPTISGRSLTEGSLSLLLNDKTIPYDGEGFEIVLLHAFLALDFLRMGRLDSALVEVRRAQEFERFERDRYDATYGMNRFGRFLAVLAHEQAAELDSARIELEKLMADMPEHPALRFSEARLSARRSQDGREREYAKAQLVVFYERGRMPEKVSSEIHLQASHAFTRISIPSFGMPPASPSTVWVQAGERKLGRTEQLEDVLGVARHNLDDRIDWMTAKSVVRSAAKLILVDQAAEKVEEEHGSVAGALVGLAGSLFASATEQADLRSWISLPREIQVLRASLPPGEHRILLKAAGGGETLDLGIVSFEPGRPVYVSVRGLNRRLHATAPTAARTSP
jgi:hypothetical protein